MECQIFSVGDEIFVQAELNVNLWTPYVFYYFNRESGKLVRLYEFADKRVSAIRVLSPERLKTLKQYSIGGWYESAMPDHVLAERPEVLENAARMLLERKEQKLKCIQQSQFGDMTLQMILMMNLVIQQ